MEPSIPDSSLSERMLSVQNSLALSAWPLLLLDAAITGILKAEVFSCTVGISPSGLKIISYSSSIWEGRRIERDVVCRQALFPVSKVKVSCS